MIITFLARITPSCKDVTALASESMDRPLPLSTRLKLQLHYWICEACARYRRQLLTLREMMRRPSSLDERTTVQSPPRLSDQAKAQLTQAFKARQD